MWVQRWGRGGWTMFAVMAVAAIAAAPVVLKTLGVHNPWWVAVVVAVAAVAVALRPTWADRLKRLAQRRDEGELAVLDGCLVTASGRLPTVRQIADPRELGVHPAAHLPAASAEGDGSGETTPVYVPRDVDDQVRGRVARGGFVLLVGDSTAGKTRTACEAIMATVPDHVVIAPKNRASVAAAVERASQVRNCVVWLNDLEHYLGADGLTRELVTKLRSGTGHRVVVATIRSAELSRLTELDAADDPAREAFRSIREVLALVDEEIRINRIFSQPERGRARDRAWDYRIRDALNRGTDYGLAEYLAAGPELLRDWRNAWDVGAHPRGAALVTAAVEARRAGLTPPLPGRLLEELAEECLQRRGGDRLRPEPLTEAWTWALHPRRATTFLLTGTPKTGFDVFDYLLDITQREATPDTYVTESTLRATLNYANGPAAHTIGATAYQQGYYAIAADAWTAALKWSNDYVGAEHPAALISRNNLALALSELGRFEEAERELRTALDIQIRILGPRHLHTLSNRSNLAVVLRRLGRFEEAEREHRTALDLRTRILGPEHPDNLISRNNLAAVLSGLGRFEEAERELRVVLDISCRIVGPEHLDTLASRNNLANVLGDLGRFEEAEREHRAALDIYTRILGSEHPDTLASRSNLAYMLRHLGRFQAAEHEHRTVLHLRTRILGPEHPDTLTSRNNLAVVLNDLGRSEEAEHEHRTALDLRTRILGPEHPDTLTSRNDLATALPNLGRSEEAEREHRTVLDLRTRILGPEHPDTLASRNNLAKVRRRQDKLTS